MVVISCKYSAPMNITENYKSEIAAAEDSFCRMAEKNGLAEAFYYFADDKASVLRGEKIISGRDAIKGYYSNQNLEGVSLVWTPDFIDVSPDGKMGYTYGKYTYSRKDPSGNSEVSKGIFHTVWKKQPDGSWKYVWD